MPILSASSPLDIAVYLQTYVSPICRVYTVLDALPGTCVQPPPNTLVFSPHNRNAAVSTMHQITPCTR